MQNLKPKYNLNKLGIKEAEYKEICSRLDREPNETEIYLFSAMWSEHCGYKHSKKELSKLPKTNGILTDENAGGVQVGDYIVFFKVESHNHPCAVEPYQGAATGIGGIIRDILALNARPIALMNSLKFGKLNKSRNKYLFERVVDAISDYGNCTGIPTIGGEVFFDTEYDDSPLVNVMCAGIVHKDKIKTSAAKPNLKIIVMGSYTGLDGVGGASFASKEISEESSQDRPCVQIGDPFMKKKLIEATLELLKEDDVIACQDCGAAGILSSTSEMAYKGNCGAKLYLDKVHTSLNNIEPWQIMLSESQERMIFVMEESAIPRIEKISQKHEVPFSIIGETIKEEVYQLYNDDKIIADLTPKILSEPILYELENETPNYIKEHSKCECNEDMQLEKAVFKILSSPSISSKNWIYNQFDYKVGNRTVLTPGQNSGSIWLYENDKHIGFTMDSNPLQVYLDPYNGMINTIYESYRNLTSNGFKPLGITNCLNFGNPEKNDGAYQLTNAINGMRHACKKLDIPVVSGNVSLYNESEKHRVYPTPTIGMIGVCDNKDSIIKSEFQKNETVILIGNDIEKSSIIGGSLYQKILFNFIGGEVNTVNSQQEELLAKTILEMNAHKLINGCIDVSQGGLFVALVKSLFTNKLGFTGNLSNTSNLLKSLFGEINGRYIISTNEEKTIKYLTEKNIPYRILGETTDSESMEFNGYNFNKTQVFETYFNTIENIICC